MSKTKSITEQIEDLQNENERLSGLEKGFSTMCSSYFGMSAKDIKKLINVSRNSGKNTHEKMQSNIGGNNPEWLSQGVEEKA